MEKAGEGFIYKISKVTEVSSAITYCALKIGLFKHCVGGRNNQVFRKDKPFTRKNDTTTLADSFIKGNEVKKPTQSQQPGIPGPSQLTQRNYPIRSSEKFRSQETSQTRFQIDSTKSNAIDFRHSQGKSSYYTQKTIEPGPSRQNSRTLRGQPTQQLMSKDPTLAQVSLPSPIYGLDEAGFRNSKNFQWSVTH